MVKIAFKWNNLGSMDMDTSTGTTRAISKKLYYDTVGTTLVRYGLWDGYGTPNEVTVLPNHTRLFKTITNIYRGSERDERH